jgi:hypothetical protein
VIGIDDVVEVDGSTVNDGGGHAFCCQVVINSASLLSSRNFRVGTMDFKEYVPQMVLENELAKAFVTLWVA